MFPKLFCAQNSFGFVIILVAVPVRSAHCQDCEFWKCL